MLNFQRSVLINAPIKAVWAFHERPDILKILTPPWQPVQALRREAGVDGMLGLGAESEFRLWLGLVPVPWVARHVACDPPFLFADIQERGPMEHWLHRHRFESVNCANQVQTRLTDDIEYALPAGTLTEPLLEQWVTSRLDDMFAYRHRVTKVACERLPVGAEAVMP